MSIPASSIPAAIRDRISAPAQPRVWTPEDFADLGPRTAVDQALHRLVASSKLRRIARGFYDTPQDNRLTGKPTYPNPHNAQRRDRVVHRQYQLLIAAKLNPAIVPPLLGEAQKWGMESSPSAMGCYRKPRIPRKLNGGALATSGDLYRMATKLITCGEIKCWVYGQQIASNLRKYSVP
jgi:hypothetical protein